MSNRSSKSSSLDWGPPEGSPCPPRGAATGDPSPPRARWVGARWDRLRRRAPDAGHGAWPDRPGALGRARVGRAPRRTGARKAHRLVGGGLGRGQALREPTSRHAPLLARLAQQREIRPPLPYSGEGWGEGKPCESRVPSCPPDPLPNPPPRTGEGIGNGSWELLSCVGLRPSPCAETPPSTGQGIGRGSREPAFVRGVGTRFTWVSWAFLPCTSEKC